jgi:hypothetical protein
VFSLKLTCRIFADSGLFLGHSDRNSTPIMLTIKLACPALGAWSFARSVGLRDTNTSRHRAAREGHLRQGRLAPESALCGSSRFLQVVESALETQMQAAVFRVPALASGSGPLHGPFNPQPRASRRRWAIIRMAHSAFASASADNPSPGLKSTPGTWQTKAKPSNPKSRVARQMTSPGLRA